MGVGMDNLIHLLKHAIGLCGEPHPSLLFGGIGVVGYCVYCINVVKNKFRDMTNNKENE